MKRYTINISFNQPLVLGAKRTETIKEDFKSLHEACKYRDIIDDTVNKALLKDNVTGNVIWWKGK
jgi:hypothetical protein